LKKTKRIAVIAFIAGLMASPQIGAQTQLDFTGNWEQNNERCVPRRAGNVVLRIDHRDPKLIVETTMLREPAPARHAVQHYTTDGRASISTGADGDEFHTSIVWQGQSLVFSVEEHEDGRVIHSKEIWTLLEHGAVLKRVRESPDGDTQQVLIYTRQIP
jgi:hypothetical protein